MSRKGPRSTAAFLTRLIQEGECRIIDLPLSSHLVIPEIQRRVVAAKGPALLFTNVNQGSFPVATNLFGSHKRIELALGRSPKHLIEDLVRLMDHLPPKWPQLQSIAKHAGAFWHLGTKRLSRPGKAPLLQRELTDLTHLPALTSWPEDGGPYVTLPLVYTQDPLTGKHNLGMYRVQIQGPRQAGMHIQIHRGGGNHFALAEQQELALPAAVYVGGPPALTLAAVAPLPEDVPELVFASLLMGEKLPLIQTPQAPFPLIADADFCLFGTMPPQVREPEGPFGDHYGYYSLKHDYPILKIDHIWHRKDAVWAATVVGRPPQEDHFIALFLQDVLSPLFPLVMKGVVDVFAYEESGVHSLAGAVVKERYGKEALTLALRILGEGQLSLSKNLLVTDGEVNPREFPSFLQHILERCDFRTDLHVLCHTSYDTLDYTSGTINLGSKAIFLGTGRERRFSLQSDLPNPSHWERFSASAMFIPGVVVVEGPSFQEEPKALDLLQQWPQLQHYRWIVLTDRGEGHACANSSSDFLWRVFTRFHPQQDLQGKRIQEGFHVGIAGPLFMDCRMKPWYPGLLIPDPKTVEEVDALWDRLNLS